MTRPRVLSDLVKCWLFLLSFIVVFVLVWYLWDPPSKCANSTETVKIQTEAPQLMRTRRRVGTDAHVKTLTGAFSNPCDNSTTIGGTTPDPYLCYNCKDGTADWCFYDLPMTKGYTTKHWAGYNAYIDVNGYKTSGNDCSNIILPTDSSWAEGTFGTSEKAKEWARRLSYNWTRNQLCFVINGTAEPLTEPTATGQYSSPTCHRFGFCIHKSGTDPCTWVSLCPNGTATQPCHHKDNEETGRPDDFTPGPKSTSESTYVVKTKKKTKVRILSYTGITESANNWMILARQAANVSARGSCVVCMGPRPVLLVVPAPMTQSCVIDVMWNKTVRPDCQTWDNVYPLTSQEAAPPIFSSKVAAGNFTCLNVTRGKGTKDVGSVSTSWCLHTVHLTTVNKPLMARSDLWWWCGGQAIRDRFPMDPSGLCALVTLLLPVDVRPLTLRDLLTNVIGEKLLFKTKIDVSPDPTYIDAIGVPRGVPDDYKLVDQVAAGFESSVCWWCTINKNVDRINYVHYNVQKLGNLTQKGFEAVHQQLTATSLMAFQNRIAIDMILAEKGGVCSMFGERCCTFIPNNTAADGSLSVAVDGLRILNKKMKEHSGVDTSMWDDWLNMFGRYKALVSSILVSLAVFTAILTLCGCCCIPCIRSLIQRLIFTAITPMKQDFTQTYTLLGEESREEDADDDKDDDHHLSDVFFDPEDYGDDDDESYV